MQAVAAVISLVALGFVIWWMLSVRNALKAIQRRMGADPDYMTMDEARAIRAEREAQQRVARGPQA